MAKKVLYHLKRKDYTFVLHTFGVTLGLSTFQKIHIWFWREKQICRLPFVCRFTSHHDRFLEQLKPNLPSDFAEPALWDPLLWCLKLCIQLSKSASINTFFKMKVCWIQKQLLLISLVLSFHPFSTTIADCISFKSFVQTNKMYRFYENLYLQVCKYNSWISPPRYACSDQRKAVHN